ncbi:MAG: hypothetical protein M1817_000828 [Caeruleum heppii]|nr:MAG: hypothetical protein M1817_000828 [Caeruleum heppii]
MKLFTSLTLASSVSLALAGSSARPRDQTLVQCVTKALGDDASKRIVAPGDATYTDARVGEKIQFDEFPALIAYTVTASEIAPLIRCAQAAGIKAVPRNGGHHFESYSALNNTLVIDIGHINAVKVSADRKTAVVGAGIRLGALYTALDAYNTSFVGGICPTVGLSGLISAGGFNMQMRALGMSADYVVAAIVVTAEGKTVTASPTSHQDLFWAIRGGGGGTYGIVTEFTLQLTQFPRSAMVFMSWSDPANRFEVSKRFLDWAPKQTKEFTAQINVYKAKTEVLGWYYGGSQSELQSIIDGSGLLDIGTPEVKVAGNCGTDNSRIFGYVLNDCIPDDQVPSFVFNVIPDPFAAFGGHPQFSYKEAPASSTRDVAPPWDRYYRISKSFFVQKQRPLSDEILQGVIDRLAATDDAAQVWAEWHAWNISSGANPDHAFAWRDQAYAHLEFQMHGSEDAATQRKYTDWMADLEGYLRPAVGSASYAGYVDAKISTPPLTSYYGDNVCRLVGVKRRYDPENFFSNPMSVGTKAPKGARC